MHFSIKACISSNIPAGSFGITFIIWPHKNISFYFLLLLQIKSTICWGSQGLVNTRKYSLLVRILLSRFYLLVGNIKNHLKRGGICLWDTLIIFHYLLAASISSKVVFHSLPLVKETQHFLAEISSGNRLRKCVEYFKRKVLMLVQLHKI
mgnify:CR=1 FL=1